VEERLAIALGNPSTYPHGNPIPGALQQESGESVLLSSVEQGDRVTVLRLSPSVETDPEFLAYLQSAGLVPGAEFTILEILPRAGTVSLDQDAKSVTLELMAAAQLWVCRKPSSLLSLMWQEVAQRTVQGQRVVTSPDPRPIRDGSALR
jgi:DtxR family Mn-dependent transcriptional regulator